MTRGQALLLTLRVTMETGIVGGLAWWGYDTGGGGGLGILLAILAPGHWLRPLGRRRLPPGRQVRRAPAARRGTRHLRTCGLGAHRHRPAQLGLGPARLVRRLPRRGLCGRAAAPPSRTHPASAAQHRPATSITTPVADQLTYPPTPHEEGPNHGPRTIQPRG